MLAPNIPESIQESTKNEIPELAKRTVQEVHSLFFWGFLFVIESRVWKIL